MSTMNNEIDNYNKNANLKNVKREKSNGIFHYNCDACGLYLLPAQQSTMSKQLSRLNMILSFAYN